MPTSDESNGYRESAKPPKLELFTYGLGSCPACEKKYDQYTYAKASWCSDHIDRECPLCGYEWRVSWPIVSGRRARRPPRDWIPSIVAGCAVAVGLVLLVGTSHGVLLALQPPSVTVAACDHQNNEARIAAEAAKARQEQTQLELQLCLAALTQDRSW